MDGGNKAINRFHAVKLIAVKYLTFSPFITFLVCVAARQQVKRLCVLQTKKCRRTQMRHLVSPVSSPAPSCERVKPEPEGECSTNQLLRIPAGPTCGVSRGESKCGWIREILSIYTSFYLPK